MQDATDFKIVGLIQLVNSKIIVREITDSDDIFDCCLEQCDDLACEFLHIINEITEEQYGMPCCSFHAVMYKTAAKNGIPPFELNH